MVQARGLAAAVLVATVSPLGAAFLAVVWIAVGRQLQADYYRANPFWANPFRRAAYLKQLALMPAWAKELRVFGLVDWLGDRFGQQWALVFGELWRARQAGRRSWLRSSPSHWLRTRSCWGWLPAPRCWAASAQGRSRCSSRACSEWRCWPTRRATSSSRMAPSQSPTSSISSGRRPLWHAL